MSPLEDGDTTGKGGGKNGRASREKQVLRCAQNDNQKGKSDLAALGAGYGGLAALGAGYGGFGFFVAFAGAFGGSLVPVLLAFG